MKRIIICFFLFLVFSWLITGSGFPQSGGSKIKDDVSPVISKLKVNPLSGAYGTVIGITIEIYDPQGLNNVRHELHQIREGIEPILLKLYDDGTHGDNTAHDRIFSGETRVPKTAATGVHEFKVVVFDKNGNRSNLLAYKFTVLKLLEV